MLESVVPSDLTANSVSEATFQSYASDHGDCILCPDTISVCPSCPPGHYCNQILRTCYSCTRYICVNDDSTDYNNYGHESVGALVGAVVGSIGGFAILTLFGFFLYYKRVYRKKNPRNPSVELDEKLDGSGVSELKSQDLETSHDRSASRYSDLTPLSHRLSTYESFTRPPRYNNKRSLGSPPGKAPQLSHEYSFSGQDLSKRNSFATTVSTSNASNILPIAYIPGVTIRPTKNNTRSIYLYDAETIFSEAAGLNTSLITQHLITPQGPAMTAVRTQPEPICVARIEEDEEPLDSEGEHGTAVDSNVIKGLDADHLTELPERALADKQETVVESDVESDSDVDSDIGKIGRANSTRRHKNATLDESDIIDDDMDDTGSFMIPIMRG